MKREDEAEVPIISISEKTWVFLVFGRNTHAFCPLLRHGETRPFPGCCQQICNSCLASLGNRSCSTFSFWLSSLASDYHGSLSSQLPQWRSTLCGRRNRHRQYP